MYCVVYVKIEDYCHTYKKEQLPLPIFPKYGIILERRVKMGLYQNINVEILVHEAIIRKCLETVKYAPEGRLFIRVRKKGRSYYRIRKVKTDEGWKDVAENITRDHSMILALTEKKIAEDQLKICRKNLKALKKVEGEIRPYAIDDIIEKLPEKYIEAWNMHLDKLRKMQDNVSYNKAPVFKESHIHVTINGLVVRSKSEMTIANILYTLGIPFNYEERFPTPDEEGKYQYPDFTIHLPNGKIIYWEHFGMLNKKDYCERNARKLHHYQLNGVCIGKNLIITQDDRDGNCDSAFIAEIVKTYILPYFKK